MTRHAVTARLKRPLERALNEGHPWVWRDALEAFQGEPGDVATVTDARGRFVARGVVDGGAIGVRVWTTRDETIDEALVHARARRAFELRRQVLPPDTDAWRLAHGEGDRMPGIVCDVYGSCAVLALDGAGAEAWRDVAVAALRPVLVDADVHALLVRTGRGERRSVDVAWGEPPEGVMSVKERAMTLRADLRAGQKTGLFLDQRESRWRVRGMARSLRVLNLYGYTGGFSVAAGLGGARAVTTVDVAPAAIALASETWAANGLDAAQHRAVTADVQDFLTTEARRGARYDLVIADPPSFAPREDALETALKTYRVLHASCLALAAPGAWYLAGSCSSHVTRAAFLETLREAAQRARKVLQVVDHWGPPPDHPTLAAFPEGEYLKNVLVRVLD